MQYFSKASGVLGKAGYRFFSGVGLSLGIGIGLFFLPLRGKACPPGEGTKTANVKAKAKATKKPTPRFPKYTLFTTVIIVNEDVDVDGKD